MRATPAATRSASSAPPARPTSPPSTTSPGSSTTPTDATPTAIRRASSPRNSSARCATASRTASAAVAAVIPCAAASARTALPPASDWNPPLAGCLMSVCSGAPCTGRYPISPAAPAAPRCSLPPRMVARPSPTPSQTSTKSSAPAAAPTARSAIAARFTSFSITTGRCRTLLSASSAPSCQAGRFTASLGSPVRGSTTPGLPMTSALSLETCTPALAQARSTAPRTSSTGSPAPLGSTPTSATRRPVTSATAALTRSDSMYRPATYALEGTTEYSAAFGPRPPACSPAMATRPRSSSLASICDTVTLDTPVYALICDLVSGSPPSSRSRAARSFSSRSRLGVPGLAPRGCPGRSRCCIAVPSSGSFVSIWQRGLSYRKLSC